MPHLLKNKIRCQSHRMHGQLYFYQRASPQIHVQMEASDAAAHSAMLCFVKYIPLYSKTLSGAPYLLLPTNNIRCFENFKQLRTKSNCATPQGAKEQRRNEDLRQFAGSRIDRPRIGRRGGGREEGCLQILYQTLVLLEGKTTFIIFCELLSSGVASIQEQGGHMDIGGGGGKSVDKQKRRPCQDVSAIVHLPRFHDTIQPPPHPIINVFTQIP